VNAPQKKKSRKNPLLRYGLRGRLILLVFISVIPALVLILHNAKRDRDVSAARIQEDAQRIVDVAAARQRSFIDSARQLLAVLAEVPEVSAGDGAACSRFMKSLADRHSVFANLGVIDVAGNLTCSAVGFSGTVELGDRSYFLRAKNSKSFAIGDYQFGRVTGRGSVNFGYPLFRGGEVGAVVYAALDLTWLTQLTREARLPSGASLSILDSQGTILARFPDPENWAGKPVPDAPLFQILQLREQAPKELIGLDGVTRLYAFTTLSGKPQSGQMYIVVGMPTEIAFAAVNRRLERNLAWLGVACVLALAISWFIGDRYVVDYVNEQATAEDARLRLASIVESSEDAIVGKSLDGTIVSWNNGAEMMYGYTADEVKGRPSAILHPPDSPNRISQLLDIVKDGKGLNRYETERIRKDGRRLYVSASVSPIRDHEGKLVGISTIARDITTLRKVEEKLRAHAQQMETLYTIGKEIGGTLALDEVIQCALDRVVSASGFGLALIHLFEKSTALGIYGSGRTARCSTQANQLLAEIGKGFERRLTACKEPWFVEDVAAMPELKALQSAGAIRALAVLPLTGREQFRGTLSLLSRNNHTFGPEECQFLQALGQQVALAIENAQLYGAMLQVNAHLQKQIEERNRAEKALADFTAMAVHDLRSPLSNIVAITESLQDGLFGTVNEQQRKWLSKVERSCQGLIEHVSDFLDLSKIEAGRIELARNPAELNALIQEALAEYSIQAAKRHICLRSQVDMKLPTLFMDSRRLNQVLGNLLSNALKFSSDGAEIEVGAHGAMGSEVIVWVKDRGTGIPTDQLEQIFDKYRQVSSGKNSGYKGTGLGLVICKKIVEAHGGRIWVESKEGTGSTFFFSLPMDALGRSETTLGANSGKTA
jgi:PAS domain S-box-containing protein